MIGFQIGNEFHNVKVFDWRTKNTGGGKPFWDTTDIGHKEREMPIEQIDRIVAPMFPMVGINAPEAIKWTPYEWLAVVERAIELVGEDHVMLGIRLRRRPDAAARHARHPRPADADGSDAEARLVRTAHQEVHGW